ncbi:MAG: hypothetical protein OWQ59_04660 [Alicyclobacillaceae bacterium]|jgi:hypothetical protein|uniref:hypothetical protein n=1 Tax=Alicyclobacillus sp. SP_1 TaxID=2942475 RepID=UPI0021584C60|nr:hypothetical protein [Alicyclobacillus sp. SP_1]MCY0887732.1 hypothetical protein [Alicyclobacillaceae bacterium]
MCCPTILYTIGVGTPVHVYFDSQKDVAATFLGLNNGTAVFLIAGAVTYVPCNKLQAVTLG